MAHRTLPKTPPEGNRLERGVAVHHHDAAVLGVISPALPRGPNDHLAVLCLDLGQRTGWALRGADGAIASGTAEFRSDRWQGGGMRFLKFKRWLNDLKQAAGGIDAVFVEEVRRHAGVDAAHAFGGWLAILTAWCEHHAIPYEAVPVGTIKRHVTGKGNASKEAVIEAVRALGHDPADDNEADALALLHWTLAHRIGRIER
jgi:Holliday junction resolvasome RuvABC endonuclease subunit